MRFTPQRREEARVDVTPLIDIIFQLVLFFMVSTTFVSSPGIRVDLPRSSADTLVREKQDVHIWMTEDGAVYVDRSPVDWEGLRRALRDAARVDPATQVIIKADRGVAHGRVVAVMDLARSLGLSRLAIATEPAPPGGGARDDGGEPD